MPVDRGAIDAQLREIGEGERWWEQREFRDLPHILHADERIRGITQGELVGFRRPRLGLRARWLIVATSQRLICLKQERFARKQVEIASGQILGIHQGSRLRSFQITIETQLRTYRIRVPKADAFRFAGALASLMPSPAAQRPGSDAEPLLLGGVPSMAALPGVVGIVSRFSLRSAPDFATRDQVERLENTVERLQHDVERLQQQVAFLEDLLQRRAQEISFPGSSPDS